MSTEQAVDDAAAANDAQFDALTNRIRDDVLVRHYEQEAVAWSAAALAPVHLGPLTTALFQLLDGSVSNGDLVGDLCDVLDATDDVARRVLRHELSMLDRGGLLATSNPLHESVDPLDMFPGRRNH